MRIGWSSIAAAISLLFLSFLVKCGDCTKESGMSVSGGIPVDDNVEPWVSGYDESHKLLGEFLCHKQIVSDDVIASGDVAFTVRSAAAHQRYLTPSELTTYGTNHFPGSLSAEYIYYHQNEALISVADTLGLDASQLLNPKAKSNTSLGDLAFMAPSAKEAAVVLPDISRFQRMLQYAIAINESALISATNLKSYLRVYAVSGVDVEKLISGLNALELFYKKRIGSSVYQWEVMCQPQFASLVQKLRLAAADVGRSASGSDSTVNSYGNLNGDTSDLSHNRSRRLVTIDDLLDEKNLSDEDRSVLRAIG